MGYGSKLQQWVMCTPNRYARVTSVLAAVLMFVVGVGVGIAGWLGSSWLWASLFLFAAAACAVMTIRPWSRLTVAVAGAATITANLMHGTLLLLGKIGDIPNVGNYPWAWIAALVGIFWYAAFVTAVLFFTRLTFLASAARTR